MSIDKACTGLTLNESCLFTSSTTARFLKWSGSQFQFCRLRVKRAKKAVRKQQREATLENETQFPWSCQQGIKKGCSRRSAFFFWPEVKKNESNGIENRVAVHSSPHWRRIALTGLLDVVGRRRSLPPSFTRPAAQECWPPQAAATTAAFSNVAAWLADQCRQQSLLEQCCGVVVFATGDRCGVLVQQQQPPYSWWYYYEWWQE
jgi:hypothetical protein